MTKCAELFLVSTAKLLPSIIHYREQHTVHTFHRLKLEGAWRMFLFPHFLGQILWYSAVVQSTQWQFQQCLAGGIKAMDLGNR